MKLLLLDKDGTLVETQSGEKFVNKSWNQQPIAGVPEALTRYVADGWKPIIISNQGGVSASNSQTGKPHKSLENTILEMRFALELLPSIAEAYFCPDRGETCWRVWDKDEIEYGVDSLLLWELGEFSGQFRKPRGGMLRLVMAIEVAEQTLYVGDRPEDQGAAFSAGIEFMWAQDWRESYHD